MCDVLADAVLVRATLNEVSAVVATVTVDEILSSPDRAFGIVVGDRLQGTPDADLDCGLPEPPGSAPGAQVFVAFARPIPADGSADYSGGLALVAWGNELTLARGFTVKSAEIADLTDRATCLKRFQRPEPPECDDTIEATCSAMPPTPRATLALSRSCWSQRSLGFEGVGVELNLDKASRRGMFTSGGPRGGAI